MFAHLSGGSFGQTLGMEGMFAFFLESSFLGLLIGARRRSFSPQGSLRRGARAVGFGSWLSGYFIIATNAFMQHPVGYTVAAVGTLQLASFQAFLLNPWALASTPITWSPRW